MTDGIKGLLGQCMLCVRPIFTDKCLRQGMLGQLSQAQHALQYEEALRSASVSSIEPILRELGGGAAPPIEVEDFKSLGKIRVMILDTNRQRLLRCRSTIVGKQSQLMGWRMSCICELQLTGGQGLVSRLPTWQWAILATCERYKTIAPTFSQFP